MKTRSTTNVIEENEYSLKYACFLFVYDACLVKMHGFSVQSLVRLRVVKWNSGRSRIFFTFFFALKQTKFNVTVNMIACIDEATYSKG